MIREFTSFTKEKFISLEKLHEQASKDLAFGGFSCVLDNLLGILIVSNKELQIIRQYEIVYDIHTGYFSVKPIWNTGGKHDKKI